MSLPASEAMARQQGFTLVEMVVALTILGLVSAALFGGIRFGTAVWRKSADYVDAGEQVRASQGFLRRMLAAAYPIVERPAGNPTSPPAVSFEGERTGLRFATVPSEEISVQTLSLSTEADALSLALVAELTPSVANGTSRKETILTNLRAIDIAYLAAATAGQPAKWETRWSGRNRLPELIRIRLSFPDGDMRAWPDLFIAPRIGGDISCRIDLSSGECLGR